MPGAEGRRPDDSGAPQHLGRLRAGLVRGASAGCGLAWCAAPESEQALRALLEAGGLQPQGVYRCLV